MASFRPNIDQILYPFSLCEDPFTIRSIYQELITGIVTHTINDHMAQHIQFQLFSFIGYSTVKTKME